VLSKVVPAILGLLGDEAATVAQLAPCVAKAPFPTSFPSGVARAIKCIFEAGLGTLKIGAVDLGGLGRNLAERVLSDAADKAVQGQSLDPGGTITLTSQQVLPKVGGGGSEPPPAEVPSTGPTYYVYHVYGTCADGACGLHERAGPGYSSYPMVGSIPEGAEVDVVCQDSGETVGPSPATGNSSAIWDRLTSGVWVSDLYITTPDVGTWSPPIPHC